MDNTFSYSALSVMGERIDTHQWVTGEIQVERYGYARPYFVCVQQGREIARLEWLRTGGRYSAENGQYWFDIDVAHNGRSAVLKDRLSRLSKLAVKRTRNPNRPVMVLSLSDADQFVVRIRFSPGDPSAFSLHVRKKYYRNELFSIHVNGASRRRRGHDEARTTATIVVNPLMKWEQKHFHQLVALVLGHLVFLGAHDRFRFDFRRNRFLRLLKARGV